MKRWHLTLILALLATGGAAMAVTLPVIGLPVEREPEPVAEVAVAEMVAPVAPVEPVSVVSDVLATAPVAPIAPIEPPPRPMRPMAVRAPRGDGVHPIHVDQGEPGGVIPELSEPARRPPVIAELPPDLDAFLGDGCPACGRG